MIQDIGKLERQLGLRFRSRQLLIEALTHSSWAHEASLAGSVRGGASGGNERLEFLGDAVLGMAVSEFLFQQQPGEREGAMSRRRSQLVCEEALAVVARQLGLGNWLQLGRTEVQMGGGERDALLADALEALIGALYLDSGWDVAKDWVRSWLPGLLDAVAQKGITGDYKTQLQEWTQALGWGTPEYETIDVAGPDHAPSFEVMVQVGGRELGRGLGASKKRAAQQAAQQALLVMKTAPDRPEGKHI